MKPKFSLHIECYSACQYMTVSAWVSDASAQWKHFTEEENISPVYNHVISGEQS